VISLNTNACNNQNFYFIRNVTDPGGTIEFLRGELAKAEAAKELVYLIGHISSAMGSCLPTWAEHYVTLVERYAHIIAGQFYGHTHSDELYIVRGLEDEKPLGVQWIPGSITTYTNKNPSYRVYKINKGTNLVMDYT
jgi:sphingomyelin phosphodiesterase